MKEPVVYRILRPILTILFKFVFKPTYKGVEQIPKEGKVILSGNHTNNLDCLLLISSTKRVIHFLAKDSLYKGWKKILFKNMGIIPVNRSIHDKKALQEAISFLHDEKAIGIFPEGTINRSKDTILPFKYGCVKMSLETDALIVPFIITGKYNIFKKNICLEYLPPYKVSGDDLTKENEKLMHIISESLEKRNKDGDS